MSSVEKLLDLAEDWADSARRYGVCADTDKAYDRLKDALTTTLEAQDARIAELEGLNRALEKLRQSKCDAIDKLMEELETRPANDDRRRFVNEHAKQLFDERITKFPIGMDCAPLAKWSHDAAEALATERDRRMQP